MITIVTLAILTILLFINTRNLLRKGLVGLEDNYKFVQDRHDLIYAENAKLQNINTNLIQELDATIALYDIAKDICKFLDEKKVFLCFKERLTQLIHVEDCKFLEKNVDLTGFVGYEIMPLKMDDCIVGYLAAKNIPMEEKEKYHILASQFILGLRRAILYKKVQELAIHDGLTDVFTRRYFLEKFNEELQRSRKFDFCFAVLMVDIDYFKDYNDRYGHLVGDSILREVSNTIKENIRQIDLLGRYGGEEFAIVLSEANSDEALFIAERIRTAVGTKIVKAYDEDLKVTVSIGITMFPHDAGSIVDLFEKADSALYCAKAQGRNRSCIYSG